jgi:hypothetical protein
MNRPYEMPYYPVPPLLGIALNLALTLVLVAFLVQSDPLALALSAGWLLLGVVAYFALNRIREASDTDEEPVTETAPEDD